MFNDANEKIEKITQIIHKAIVNVSILLGFLPIAAYSYFVYFTTDSGKDAFRLPMNLKLVIDSSDACFQPQN